MPIIEGKAKLLNYLRQKPAVAFFNRVNLLNKLLNKVDDITNEYYLKLYLQKQRQNVEDIKEEKRKILLSFIKKKIRDERELKIWAFVAKVPFIIDNGEIKTIGGKKVTG